MQRSAPAGERAPQPDDLETPRGPRPERPAAHSKRPRGGGGGGPGGRSRAAVPAERAPLPAGGSPRRAGLAFLVLLLVSLRLVPRRAGWFLGRRAAPGAGVRLVRAPPGERAGPGPAEKPAFPGRARGRLHPEVPLLRVST